MSRFRWLDALSRWPLARQVITGDVHGLGATAMSSRTAALAPRTASADRVVRSVCPYKLSKDRHFVEKLHRGTFAGPFQAAMVPTLDLVAQSVGTVSAPVI